MIALYLAGWLVAAVVIGTALKATARVNAPLPLAFVSAVTALLWPALGFAFLWWWLTRRWLPRTPGGDPT